jgi:hypothetical protein
MDLDVTHDYIIVVRHLEQKMPVGGSMCRWKMRLKWILKINRIFLDLLSELGYKIYFRNVRRQLVDGKVRISSE